MTPCRACIWVHNYAPSSYSFAPNNFNAFLASQTQYSLATVYSSKQIISIAFNTYLQRISLNLTDLQQNVPLVLIELMLLMLLNPDNKLTSVDSLQFHNTHITCH